jgi:hypothetical protein
MCLFNTAEYTTSNLGEVSELLSIRVGLQHTTAPTWHGSEEGIFSQVACYKLEV